MDAVVNGKPVTPRIGYVVEINALWYNALVFSLELAKRAKDDAFISDWEHLPPLVKESFMQVFWDPEKSYLADVADFESIDWTVRPNQVIAASVEFSPVNNEIKKAVLDVVERDLLTSRGLRSLSPKNINYKGVYCGNPEERDMAYHQGTVWPWLLEHFFEGYMSLHKESGLAKLTKYLSSFEDVLSEAGIGTISEIFDGDPPHRCRGAVSQAWSVAALLRMIQLQQKYSAKD